MISTSTYTVGVSGTQSYTIGGDGDVNYIRFSAEQGRSYTIKTSNLLNGVDTYITLLNSDQTTTTPNTTTANPDDNANGTIYSSITVPSDVYPSICDSDGVCHENGYDILGSYLRFSPISSATYYLKVQSSGTRPVSAGRYGSYSLLITSP